MQFCHGRQIDAKMNCVSLFSAIVCPHRQKTGPQTVQSQIDIRLR